MIQSEMIRSKTLPLTFLVAVCLLLIMSANTFSGQRESVGPIAEEGLLKSLGVRALSSKELTQEVQRRGVDFHLTLTVEQELQKAGKYLGKKGLGALIAAIRNNYRPPNTSPAEAKPKEPTFSEDTATVKVTIGANDVVFDMSRLEKGPVSWDLMSPIIPIMIYVKDKRPYVDATLYSGHSVPVQLKGNKLISYPPSWDYNSNEHAIEIVNHELIPVFQVIYNRPNHIIINGIFVVRNSLGAFDILVATESGIFMNPTNPTLFRRIFKYPSWQHKGEYVAQ
jgi:hypothetical protein